MKNFFSKMIGTKFCLLNMRNCFLKNKNIEKEKASMGTAIVFD